MNRIVRPYLYRNYNARVRDNTNQELRRYNDQISAGGAVFGLPNPYTVIANMNPNTELTNNGISIDPTVLLGAIFAISTVKTKRYQVNKLNRFCEENMIVNQDLKVNWYTITAFIIYLVRNEYAATSILQYTSNIINTAVFLELMRSAINNDARARQTFHFARVMAKRHQPRKAPPILAVRIRSLTNTREKPLRGAIILWILSGLRYGSLKFVDHDCISVNDDNTEITILPKKNKIENEGQLKCTIRCNCNTRLGDEFCLFHNNELHFPNFPWSPTLVKDMLTELGCSLHSARRTLAISLRRLENVLGEIGKRANNIFFWSAKSRMFSVYACDHELYENVEFIPINGILHRINNRNGIQRKRRNNNDNRNNNNDDNNSDSNTDPDIEYRNHMNDNIDNNDLNGRTRTVNHNGFGMMDNDDNGDNLAIVA